MCVCMHVYMGVSKKGVITKSLDSLEKGTKQSLEETKHTATNEIRKKRVRSYTRVHVTTTYVEYSGIISHSSYHTIFSTTHHTLHNTLHSPQHTTLSTTHHTLHNTPHSPQHTTLSTTYHTLYNTPHSSHAQSSSLEVLKWLKDSCSAKDSPLQQIGQAQPCLVKPLL